MSNKDTVVVETPEVVDTTAVTTPVADEVTTRLVELGLSAEVAEQLKSDLGLSAVGDLELVTEQDLKDAGIKPIVARKFLGAVAPAPKVADTPVVSSAAFEAVLPEIQDDASWLLALKTGGVLKVNKATVGAAIRAALAKRVGLYEVPAKLAAAMEQFADESEEQVDPSFFALRKQITRRGYADIFEAIEGLDGSFVTEKRKATLLTRLDQYLWPAISSFNTQLRGWQESWVQGAANPSVMMMALMGGGAGALPPGVMQAPDTAALRDAADAVNDAINKVFAGTGVQIASALAYEAMEVKKSLEDARLPALIGVANRDQLLKKLGVAVPATYPRLETNLIRFIMGVLSLEDQAAGNEELSYLGALYMLGNQIDWSQLGGSRGFQRLGGGNLRANAEL